MVALVKASGFLVAKIIPIGFTLVNEFIHMN